MYNYGFSSLSKNLHLDSNSYNLNKQLKELESKVFYARVTDVILDENHPKFNLYGGWNGLGIIEFEFLDKNSDEKSKAYPLFSFIKNYPLVDEIVLIFKSPNRDIDEISNLSSFYYLSTLNLWNSNHHNAYPNPFQSSENRPYFNSPLNSGSFVERDNIPTLLPFAGDNIFEGRFGNSIRLGSTSKNKYNIWSIDGTNGDPILILRNSNIQNNQNEKWVPSSENPNIDLSSIYLTSTQRLPIKTTYDDYSAFKNIPLLPRTYNKNQILLSSGRLILDAKDDGIILSGHNFISLNSYKEIGINSREAFTVNSSKINLGGKDSTQQLILGNKLIDQLVQLTNTLINTIQVLEDTLKTYPGGMEAPHPASIPLSLQKDALKDVLTTFKSGKLLSNISRTL